MKKTMLMVGFALVFSGATTGCAAKKRVKALEAELSRCRMEKERLQSGEIEQENDQQNGAESATVAARDE